MAAFSLLGLGAPASADLLGGLTDPVEDVGRSVEDIENAVEDAAEPVVDAIEDAADQPKDVLPTTTSTTTTTIATVPATTTTTVAPAPSSESPPAEVPADSSEESDAGAAAPVRPPPDSGEDPPPTEPGGRRAVRLFEGLAADAGSAGVGSGALAGPAADPSIYGRLLGWLTTAGVLGTLAGPLLALEILLRAIVSAGSGLVAPLSLLGAFLVLGRERLALGR